MSVERKCPKCSAWNGNSDFCTTCGEALAPDIIEARKEALREPLWKPDPVTAFDRFMYAWRHSPFFLFRWIFYVFYSVGMLFFAIASFLAYITIGANG